MSVRGLAGQFDDLDQQHDADLKGMWVFLATELLLFGGVFTAFAVYRVAYPSVFAEAAGHLDLLLGSLNTAVLLTSGLTIALADKEIEQQRRQAGLGWLTTTLALASLFLAIKFYEWHHEYQQALLPLPGLPFHFPGEHDLQAELFFNFYYVLTGLHAFHMTVGVTLLGVILWLVARWRDAATVARQVRIVGLYWAFVDVVWIFVFTSLYLLRA